MLKIGLTGGIAAGKSTVGEMFVKRGAYLIQADRIGHDLLQPGTAVYQSVVQHFGPEILNPDRTINRARLAEAAFCSAQGQSRIEELNRLIHPEVIRRQEQWMDDIAREHPSSIAIVEAALILEAGAAKQFDRIIVVTCKPEQRIERWAHRTHVDHDTARLEVERRMAAQLPDEVKIKSANFVIDNSGSIEVTREQADRVYDELQTIAASRH